METLGEIQEQQARAKRAGEVVDKLGHRVTLPFVNLKGASLMDQIERTGDVRKKIETVTIPRLRYLMDELNGRLEEISPLTQRLTRIAALADQGYLTPEEVAIAEHAAEQELKNHVFSPGPETPAVPAQPVGYLRRTADSVDSIPMRIMNLLASSYVPISVETIQEEFCPDVPLDEAAHRMSMHFSLSRKYLKNINSPYTIGVIDSGNPDDSGYQLMKVPEEVSIDPETVFKYGRPVWRAEAIREVLRNMPIGQAYTYTSLIDLLEPGASYKSYASEISIGISDFKKSGQKVIKITIGRKSYFINQGLADVSRS